METLTVRTGWSNVSLGKGGKLEGREGNGLIFGPADIVRSLREMQSHGEPGAEDGQDLTEVLNMLRLLCFKYTGDARGVLTKGTTGRLLETSSGEWERCRAEKRWDSDTLEC